MKISDIKIGQRHRRDRHDPTLGALADSIKEQGLLQPIGVTEDNELVFGYRRLMAVQMAPLWWREIEARVVNVTSIAAGEFAENEMRKNFTISERVAILETIKRNTVGRPKENRKDLFNKTDAAKLAGFGNPTTAREAKIIVTNGIPELVEAVDNGEIAVFSGALIASQPPEAQQKLMKTTGKQRKNEIKNLRGVRTPLSLGRKIKRPVFQRREFARMPTFTPQEVDPEFTGTPTEFTDKYGHVQVMTAEQYATTRYSDWALAMRSLAKYAKTMPSLPEVDHNWLRSPKARDVGWMIEALNVLRPLMAEAEALLERATALQKELA